MLSIIGLIIILTIVGLLLSGKVLPSVAMTIVPIVGALVAGFSLQDIDVFFNSGFSKVIHIAIMFIFAILYFGIMQDVGLFNPIVKGVLRFAKGNVVAVAICTVLVAAITHLDGSGASTFLITIPLLLPIYKELRMSPYLLVLLIGASASIMNMLPWAGPVGRVASVIGMHPTKLWHPLIIIQIMGMMFLILLTIFLAKRENKRIASGYNVSKHLDHKDYDIEETDSLTEKPSFQIRKNTYWINFAITICLITSLVLRLVPIELSFMIALSIALPLNFPKVSDRANRIKAHSSGALMMALIILSAGVFLGVLDGSGMLKALANSIIDILPTPILNNISIIISIFGMPFEMVLNTDAYYFGLLPIVTEVASSYGVTPQSTSYMMLVSNVAGTFISPFSPALWLAIGLAGIDIGKYIKYSFLWIWGLSLFLLLCTVIFVV